MPTNRTKVLERVSIKAYLDSFDDVDMDQITYPDPPDCVAKLKDGCSIWIEARTIYRHRKLAKSINGPSGFHRETLGTISDYYVSIIDEIKVGIKQKDGYKNYESLTAEYGRGILILSIDDPLAAAEDIDFVKHPTHYSEISLLNFHSVYLYVPPMGSINYDGVSTRSGLFLLLSVQF
jgi:hypothetical protein